jgi:hypothetical protein
MEGPRNIENKPQWEEGEREQVINKLEGISGDLKSLSITVKSGAVKAFEEMVADDPLMAKINTDEKVLDIYETVADQISDAKEDIEAPGQAAA